MAAADLKKSILAFRTESRDRYGSENLGHPSNVSQVLGLNKARILAMALLLEVAPKIVVDALDKLVWRADLSEETLAEARLEMGFHTDICPMDAKTAQALIDLNEETFEISLAQDSFDLVRAINKKNERGIPAILVEAMRLGLRSIERDHIAESIGDDLGDESQHGDRREALPPYDWGGVDPMTLGKPIIHTPNGLFVVDESFGEEADQGFELPELIKPSPEAPPKTRAEWMGRLMKNAGDHFREDLLSLDATLRGADDFLAGRNPEPYIAAAALQEQEACLRIVLERADQAKESGDLALGLELLALAARIRSGEAH